MLDKTVYHNPTQKPHTLCVAAAYIFRYHDNYGRTEAMQRGMSLFFYLVCLVGTAAAWATDELPPVHIEQEITLQAGEALTQALQRAGVGGKQAFAIAHPLQKKVALNLLRPGDSIALHSMLNIATGTPTLQAIKFIAPGDKIAAVQIKDGKPLMQVKDRPLTTHKAVAVGHIHGSLYQAGQKAGLPAALVPGFADLFAYELDFTRDIQAGDVFRVIFEEIRDENGDYVRSGEILAAELHSRGKKRSAYRYLVNGVPEYYDEAGRPKKKLLLRTPLEFTRISSHYNPNRKHPVLGYTRAHRGTDFAAPTGTPIKASGSGIIERANRYGSFGNYVRIRHNNKYKTAYAHLHRIARGIRNGTRVKQGQIIGYVGSTGRSTGPHLHYEVHVYGKQVNPMTANIPAGNPLKGQQQRKFQTVVASMQDMWDEADPQVASR